MPQKWNADEYNAHGRFVTKLGEPLIELLAPQPGEVILDLGCGDGVLTAMLAATGAQIIGIDSSPDFIAAAQQLGLDARLMNALELSIDEQFDGVFSNAALHWMAEPEQIVRNVRRHLKPAGRFVGEFGGFGNVAAISTAIRAVLERHGIDTSGIHPWYFPSAEEYRQLLEKNGFCVENISLFPRPTPLPTGIEPWLRTFTGPFFGTIDDETRQSMFGEIAKLLKPALCDWEGTWTVDYVRLRFKAIAQ